MNKTFIRITLAALFALGVNANATTLGFDSLTDGGTGWTSIQRNVTTDISRYEENGFQLVTGGLGFGSAHSGTTGWYFGSASLFNDDTNHGLTTLSRTEGGAFTLNSIDLAPLSTSFTFGSGVDVTFIGNVHGGGTVTESFHLSQPTSFETFFFTAFENLDSVMWTQDSPYHQFDNIVLDALGDTDVPEPATIALLGLGLAGFAFIRRKYSK